MNIKPIGNKLQISIEKPTAGKLDLSSLSAATEYGKIIALGENVKGFNIGDMIFFKAWATDIIGYEGEQYYFINSDSEGICAIVTE